jgi:hypothetical protein
MLERCGRRRPHPSPISLASPLFTDRFGQSRNFNRVAFEANMPRIEAADFGSNCNRSTGVGCTKPPPNANFYPIYSIQRAGESCRWNLGGPFIPGTTSSFGGTSVSEYGAFFALLFPSKTGPTQIIENYRRILPFNPCQGESEDEF